MDIKDLIPKDKLDTETAEKLTEYSFEQIKPIIPDLLEWIQDMNWPVASTVAEYLVTISDNLTTEIVEILNGKDEMWKYWCIGVFGINSDKPMHPNVLKVVKRIADKPTLAEKKCGVDDQAIRALNE